MRNLPGYGENKGGKPQQLDHCGTRLMKTAFSRFIAIMLLVIPGFTATYGFLAMKNAFFAQFETDGAMQWGKFVLGFILFLAGVAFIAGWVFYRDRKRNYVAPRFKKKRGKRPVRKNNVE